jgi:hypothetical protein
MEMLSDEEQHQRLRSFLEDMAGWNAMVLIQRPGDVVTLHPIAPDLRGVEIVAAMDDGKLDLWRNGRPWKMDMTHAQAAEFIMSKSPSEELFMKHGAKWAEALFQRLGIPRRNDDN